MLLIIEFLIFFSVIFSTQSFAGQLAYEPLIELNHYNPIEPAHSRGSLGFNIGIGYEQQEWSDNSFLSHQFDISTKNKTTRLNVLNAYFHKGTPWPVDFGVLFSQVDTTSITRVGGHVQWTAFQGFRLPSLAFRIQGSRTYGLNSLSIDGLGTSAAIDYGFLRYFNLVASYSMQRDKIQRAEETDNLFTLEDIPDNQTTISTATSYGMGITLVPGFIAINIFNQKFSHRDDRYLMKLIIEI